MVFTAVALAVLSAAQGHAAAREVQSKETVDLLSGLSLLYESPRTRTTAFSLRAFLFRSDGECAPDAICAKDKLMIVVSTFDEYPEKRAFEVPVVGAFSRIAISSMPKQESGSYSIAAYSKSGEGKESCDGYTVSLGEMKPSVSACR